MAESSCKPLAVASTSIGTFQNRSTLADGAGMGARQLASVAEVCAASDYVSLHCAATPQTANIMNADAIAAMRPGGYLINTARGDVVDEAALVAALMIVFPVSKLLHAPGVFFSPGRNQVDNPREKRHLAPWAARLEAGAKR